MDDTATLVSASSAGRVAIISLLFHQVFGYILSQKVEVKP